MELNMELLRKNLIASQDDYKKWNSLERLMKYRNDDQLPDMDRSPISKQVYKEIWDWTDGCGLDADTFFISPYNTMRILCLKCDREEESNYYVTSFESFIRSKGICYDSLSHLEAQRLRKEWFLDGNTIKHYGFLTDSVVMSYIDAGHKVGNFMLIPRGHGSVKCIKFSESPFKYLEEVERNWDTLKVHYGGIEFVEMRAKFLLDGGLYDGNRLMVEYDFDVYDDWDSIKESLQFMTDFVNRRTDLMIKTLENKEVI